MDEIKVFVAPYSKPNVGSWFTLPTSVSGIEATVRKIVGDETIEEFVVVDYEAPFKLFDTDLDSLNDLAERIGDLPKIVRENLIRLTEYEDIEEILDSEGDNFVFTGETEMEEVAIEYVESCGGVESALGDRVDFYIDYHKLGRDMEIEGSYFEGVGGEIIEYVG
ncbi:antirestriction protein ArdA [Enterococcus wangshanyuanii]|uniref:Antirestriction protein ArdA n=1 Tax=Enterococcus wangshanyuanii TaxID=2005703 RepID=A0ABQ1PD91_9ENTE|nr:antirestriction protein ArdA [Enterococcus wangshanyuanii]GGC94902.1 antirestriction protein ArdA [Enterococcus wangshanyuanii]